MGIILCSFFEALRLPWKFVISASTRGGLKRYHEGDPNFQPLPYSHIYCMVGDRPFTPKQWFYCEPTLTVPFGWDIVQAQHDPNARQYLPELGSTVTGMIGGAVGEAVSEESSARSPTEEEGGLSKFAKQIGLAIVVGSLTAVGTEILLDYLRSSDAYKALMSREARRKRGTA